MSYGVGELLEKPEVQRLADYTQHHFSSRLEHCIAVSYESYLLAKKFHLGCSHGSGLLHDLFYYDWRVTKFGAKFPTLDALLHLSHAFPVKLSHWSPFLTQ